MSKVYLSVIIPAYNEEKRIAKTLFSIDHYLSGQDYSYEIIVVDDGSTDKTVSIIQNLTHLVKNLRVINSQPNHGKGYVVRLGMLEAKGQYRLFMDADNSTSIEHLEKMWPYFEQGYQVVIGSRDRKDVVGAKQAVPQSFLKRQLGNLGNLLIQLVAVPGVWDTQCGFKAFTAKAAKDIFSRCQINRWGFDIEALALARRLKYKIAIIPVYWINDPHSHVNWKGYLRTFWELFKIKWNLIIDKYSLKHKN
jgi:dolichyl-phosphate beta-glucosyltransferase